MKKFSLIFIILTTLTGKSEGSRTDTENEYSLGECTTLGTFHMLFPDDPELSKEQLEETFGPSALITLFENFRRNTFAPIRRPETSSESCSSSTVINRRPASHPGALKVTNTNTATSRNSKTRKDIDRWKKGEIKLSELVLKDTSDEESDSAAYFLTKHTKVQKRHSPRSKRSLSNNHHIYVSSDSDSYYSEASDSTIEHDFTEQDDRPRGRRKQRTSRPSSMRSTPRSTPRSSSTRSTPTRSTPRSSPYHQSSTQRSSTRSPSPYHLPSSANSCPAVVSHHLDRLVPVHLRGSHSTAWLNRPTYYVDVDDAYDLRSALKTSRRYADEHEETSQQTTIASSEGPRNTIGPQNTQNQQNTQILTDNEHNEQEPYRSEEITDISAISEESADIPEELRIMDEIPDVVLTDGHESSNSDEDFNVNDPSTINTEHEDINTKDALSSINTDKEHKNEDISSSLPVSLTTNPVDTTATTDALTTSVACDVDHDDSGIIHDSEDSGQLEIIPFSLQSTFIHEPEPAPMPIISSAIRTSSNNIPIDHDGETEQMKNLMSQLQSVLLIMAAITLSSIIAYSIYYINLIRKIYSKNRISK